MIHGWPDSYRLWDGQVAVLKERYRCVRFTLPGFDLGPKRAYALDEIIATVRRVIEQTSPQQKVTLLLHDWGCFMGYQFALRHPELVERVVGVDIGGDAGTRAHRAELGARGLFMVLAYQLWLALAWKIGGRIGDAMARAMARMLRCPTDQSAIGAQMGYTYAMRWFGVAGGFPGVRTFEPQVPMLYVYGERKPLMFHSRAWVERVAARPGNRVVPFATGHWVMVTAREKFNAELLAWLGESRAN